jgi:Tfp pilus assembly protein PilV
MVIQQKQQEFVRRGSNTINKKALTLFEILVSVIILALVITGLANVFVAGKRYIRHSRMRMGGGEIGKQFLDPLQSYVRQDTWGTNPLGSNTIPNATEDIYTATYDTKNHPDFPVIKRVKVTISLPEAE